MDIRRAVPADTPAVLRLLTSSLGWLPDDEHATFFSWKHEQSPFGPSLAWVAEEEGHIVGFRAFLRWEFERDGEVVHAARAVDTATHPDHRGKGIFSRLTLHSLGELHGAGIQFVFNTPNDQSRPGYLKMGWKVLGRVRTVARPRSLWSLGRMATAHTAADLWSTPTTAAAPAVEVLADAAGMTSLLDSQPASPFLRTRLSNEYLSWRYAGMESLSYRAHVTRRGVGAGVALYRLRSRGGALEATIGQLLVPAGERRQAAAIARDVLRDSGADYAISSDRHLGVRSGFFPLARQGPVVTVRALGRNHAGPPVQLSLGDIELL